MKKTESKENKGLRIPTREEFHRFASNRLSDSDFYTNHPSGIQINKISSAIRWTYDNEKRRNEYHA